ncbi:YraN family protein [Candidatus Peregrinibacteria bacterium]|nr:YraN family protein [Candidatus Peregrinibacteria bacterium]MBT7736670.1 YraN family protein [Candidatus Peregrinibacteria bacterium]
MDRKMVGILGEEISKRYLESKGHQIMETNFHSRFGEIDIISEKDSEIIFTEVKTRTSNKFGTPEESLTQKKLNRIKKTVFHFLNTSTNLHNFNWRIDLITVRLDLGKSSAHLKHFKNINGSAYS